MSRSSARLIAVVPLAAALLLGPTAAAFAADRIPVASVDDASLSLTNRIGAVDNVVVAIDARIDRIIRSYPPGPPTRELVDSLIMTQASLDTLISTVDAQTCTQDGTFGMGDPSLADGDAFAGDGTTTGLLNQLGAVRSVVTEANGRLVRIGGAYPAGPPVRELEEALTAVRNSSAAGFDAIAARLGGDIHPPSPCHTA